LDVGSDYLFKSVPSHDNGSESTLTNPADWIAQTLALPEVKKVEEDVEKSEMEENEMEGNEEEEAMEVDEKVEKGGGSERDGSEEPQQVNLVKEEGEGKDDRT
jgi:hypothetical protein